MAMFRIQCFFFRTTYPENLLENPGLQTFLGNDMAYPLLSKANVELKIHPFHPSGQILP